MTTPQDPTVELPDDTRTTIQLPDPGPTTELPDTRTTIQLPDPGPTTELPGSPTTAEPAAGQDGLRRFGPGVPAPTAEVPPRLAALWQGGEGTGAEAGRPGPNRRSRRWLVPVLVLLAVLAFLLWEWRPHPLAVTGLSVRTDTSAQACDGTAVVTGTLDTNGGSGTVTYRWHRSDGTVSADLTQTVPRGSRHTDVVLRWTFEGKGTMTATATLEVLTPAPRTAATTFTYSCG